MNPTATAASLPLRDIHIGMAPSWWPPAPGWWLLAIAIACAVWGLTQWWLRQRRYRLAVLQEFDRALARAQTPEEQVAQMSELLRRAVRRSNPEADTLTGDAWLQLLDAGAKQPQFVGEYGSLLCEGGYRRRVDPRAAEALLQRARSSYLRWMLRT